VGAFFAHLAALLALRMDWNAVHGHRVAQCMLFYDNACVHACMQMACTRTMLELMS